MVKRVSVLLFTFLFSLSVYAQFTNPVVSVTANDGTGDSLRLTIQKLIYADNWLNSNLTTVSNLAVSGGSAVTKMATNNGSSWGQTLYGAITNADNTASRVLILDSAKRQTNSTVTDTELGYLSGVTSGVQGQIAGREKKFWFNVVDYGADTNGLVDSRTAFVNALAAVPAGGTLYAPPGTYIFSSAWTISKSNVELRGSGAGGCVLRYAAATETATFLVVAADNVRITGFDIDAQNKAYAAIWLDNGSSGSDNIEIDHNKIRRAYANSVNDPTAVGIAGGIYIRRGCNTLWIHHNEIYENNYEFEATETRVASGIVISDFGYTGGEEITGVSIEANKIHSNGLTDHGSGVRILTQAFTYDTRTLIIGNEFSNNSRRDVKIVGDGVVVAGNTFNSPDDTYRYSTVSFNNGRNLKFSNNLITGEFTDKIMESGTGSTPVSNFEFTDNIIQSSGGGDMVRIRNLSRNGLISGNRAARVRHIAWVDGDVTDVDFINNGATNILWDAVNVSSDGTNAPNRVSFLNTTAINVATNMFRLVAGTNIHLGRYFATTVGGSAEVISAGVTGTRSWNWDIQDTPADGEVAMWDNASGKTLWSTNFVKAANIDTLAELNALISDADVASLSGAETLANKTLTTPNIGAATGTSLVLSGDATVATEVYDATGWNGDNTVPTKDAVRDKIESLGASSITGTDTHVLFFDGADSPAGDAGLTYNKTTDALTVAGTVTAARVEVNSGSPTDSNIAIYDDDASHKLTIQSADTTTTDVNLIWSAAPGDGFLFGTVTGTTNETITHVTATGSGSVVRATSPTLVTPALGAATGTSLVLSGDATVATEAYDATGWNGDNTVPTKDAVRDKIESMSGGSSFNPSTAWSLFDEFLSDTVPAYPWQISNSGAGADVTSFASADANRPGTVVFKAGTTTTGRASLYTGRSGFFLSGGAATWEAWVKIPVLSDGTDEYDFFIGMGDNRDAIAQTDGIIFSYDRNASTNWRLTAYKAGAASSVIDLGSAVTADTWVKLGFTVNAGATSVQGYVNGVSAGSAITANIPDTVSNLMAAAMATIVKSAGTTDRTARVDYIWVTQTFTTPR